MLKLNASFSKKVPAEQEYSSKGYSATIEVELPDGLNQEQLRQRIHETFQMVEASVESEISGSNVNVPQQAAPQATATIPMRQASVNPRSQSSSKAPVAASAKQIKFLLDIARRINVDLTPYLNQLGVDAPERLNRHQCSALIDQLNGIGKAA